MLQGTIDTKAFKDFIDSIHAMANECRLHINENGIHTSCVDPGGVGMVKSVCKKEVFSNFLSTPADIGISVAKLKTSIGSINTKDCIVEYTESSGRLSIAGGSNKYSMRVLAQETLRADPPKDPVDFFEMLPTHLQVDGSALASAIRTVAAIGDKVVFDHVGGTHELKLYFEEDLETIQSGVDPSKVAVIKGTEDARTILPADYIKSVAPVMSRADMVNVYIGNDMPAAFSMLINDSIEATYIIAPRIAG